MIPGLGPLEAAVMEVLWEASGPLAVRQVRERLTDHATAYTTISTVLENLRRKGWVDREQLGRVWFYRPVRDRSAHAADVMHEALTGSRDSEATLLRFVDGMSPRDVRALRALLDGLPPEEES
ncbi:BlaI/MecI/CopY family transcriptional regulator [Nocardiopsis sp. RV163]|uniref:BlaI/MecI/CopY family transcriptional regulator n=1 Tax=Nocardiopsis sp. RV163 TaxID=1661388 RepID=UPI00064BDFBA|nr:BlaI/MecI/CopY family transcriptional regulator [Nocardiopsis sp. RV163]